MGDAQILEAMRNQQEEIYTQAYDMYDECLEKISKDAEQYLKSIASIIEHYANEYGFDKRTILDEMVLPTLEAKIF